MKKIIGLLLLNILLFNLSANGQSDNFDYGQVVNNKYVNSFFKLSIDIPENWAVQTKEKNEEFMRRGEELMAGDDQNMKAIIKAAEVNYAALVTAFKYEIGSPVDYNPSFVLMAENLKNAPGVKTGADYLFLSRKLIEQSQLKYDHIDEKFKRVVINNKEFYSMKASITIKGTNIQQLYYSTIQNGFCISLIISYTDKAQKKELEKVANTLIFK